MEDYQYEEVYQYCSTGQYPSQFSKNEKRSLRRKCQKHYKADQGNLYYTSGFAQEWRQVPRDYQHVQRILQSCHSDLEGGHFGRDKTIDKISARFYWKNLHKDVRHFVQQCDTCQRTNDVKFPKNAAPLHLIPVKSKVWDQVGIDLIGPLPITANGNRFIVTMMDFFSKWPEAAPLPNKSATSVASFLYQMICRHGCPRIIISDQGREFVNAVNKRLFRMTKTDHRISSAYHPQTNGLVERFNQTLQRALVKVVNENQDDWDEKLEGVLFAYRTAPQKSTKYSPFELVHCRKAVLPIELEMCSQGDDNDILQDSGDGVEQLDIYVEGMNSFRAGIFEEAKGNIKSAQRRMKKDYDRKNMRVKKFKNGSLVLVRNSARDCRKGGKLGKRWLGPYVIVSKGKGIYSVKNPATGLKTYHKHITPKLSNSSLFQNASQESIRVTQTPKKKKVIKLDKFLDDSTLSLSNEDASLKIPVSYQEPSSQHFNPSTSCHNSHHHDLSFQHSANSSSCHNSYQELQSLEEQQLSHSTTTIGGLVTSSPLHSGGYFPDFFPNNLQELSPIPKMKPSQTPPAEQPAKDCTRIKNKTLPKKLTFF